MEIGAPISLDFLLERSHKLTAHRFESDILPRKVDARPQLAGLSYSVHSQITTEEVTCDTHRTNL